MVSHLHRCRFLEQTVVLVAVVVADMMVVDMIVVKFVVVHSHLVAAVVEDYCIRYHYLAYFGLVNYCIHHSVDQRQGLDPLLWYLASVDSLQLWHVCFFYFHLGLSTAQA